MPYERKHAYQSLLNDAEPTAQTGTTTSYNTANPLDDPRFYDDLRQYYASKGHYAEDDELLKQWYEDRTWGNMNSLFSGGDWYEAETSNAEERALQKRLQEAYEQSPMFWQEGGAGERIGYGNVVADILGAVVLDPLNLVPVAKASTVARAAKLAGASSGAALRRGMGAGALTEGVVAAGTEAVINTATQNRDMTLGLQEDFDLKELGISAGIGAAIGGTMGGIVSYFASRHGVKVAESAIGELKSYGVTDEQLTQLSSDDFDQLFPDGRLNRDEAKKLVEGAESQSDAPEAAVAQTPDGEYTIRPSRKVEEIRADRAAEQAVANDSEQAAQEMGEFQLEVSALTHELEGIDPATPEYGQTQKALRYNEQMLALLKREEITREQASEALSKGDTAKHEKLIKELDEAKKHRATIIKRYVDGDEPEALASETSSEAPETEVTADPGTTPKSEAQPVTTENPVEDVVATAEAEEPTVQAESSAVEPDVQPPSAEAEPTKAKVRMSDFKDELNHIPELAGLKHFNLRTVRAQAKAMDVQDANKLNAEQLRDALIKADLERTQKEATTMQDLSETYVEAMEDFAEEVFGQGEPPKSFNDPDVFRRWLMGRNAFAPDAEELVKMYRATKAKVTAKMEDGSIDYADMDQFGGETLASVMEQSLDANVKDYVVDLLAYAVERDISFGKPEIKKFQRIAEKARENSEGVAELFRHTALGNNAMTAGDIAFQSSFIDQLENYLVKHSGESLENIRSVTQTWERLAKYIPEDVKDATRRASNFVNLSEFEKAKAQLAETPTAQVPFAAKKGQHYYNANGEKLTAKRGQKLWLVNDAQGKQWVMKDVPSIASMYNGWSHGINSSARERLAAAKPTEISKHRGKVDKPNITQADAPPNRHVAVALNRGGSWEVRVLSPSQIAAGKDVTAVLGQSRGNWIVGHVNDKFTVPYGETISDAAFRKEFSTDFSVAPTTTREQHLTRRVPEFTDITDQIVPYPVRDLLELKLTDPTMQAQLTTELTEVRMNGGLDDSLDDVFFNVKGLRDIIARVEQNMKWMDGNGDVNKDTMTDLLTVLDKLYAAEESAFPHGVRYPSQARGVAVAKLNEIFNDYGHRTMSYTHDLINRLAIGNPRGNAPNVVSNGKGAPDFKIDANDPNFNSIGLPNADDATQRPRVYAVLHESGHWAYMNSLTPKEKRKFVTSLNTLIQSGEIKRALPNWDVNYGTVGEAFAELFATWAAKTRYQPVVLNDSFWQKVAVKIKAIYDRFVSGKSAKDLSTSPELEEMFRRILPDNDEIKRIADVSGKNTYANARDFIKAYKDKRLRDTRRDSKDGESVETDMGAAVRLARNLLGVGEEIANLDQALADGGADWKKLLDAPILDLARDLYALNDIARLKDVNGKSVVRKQLNRMTNVLQELKDYASTNMEVTDLKYLGTDFDTYRTESGNPNASFFDFERDVLLNPEDSRSVHFILNTLSTRLRSDIYAKTGAWIDAPDPILNEAIVKRAQKAISQHSKGNKARANPSMGTRIDARKGKAKADASIKKLADAADKQAQRQENTAEVKIKETVAKTKRGKQPKPESKAPKMTDSVKVLRKAVASDDEAVSRQAAFELAAKLNQTQTLRGHSKPEVEQRWLGATRRELREGMIDAIKRGEDGIDDLAQIEWVLKQRGAMRAMGIADQGRAYLPDEIDNQAMLKPKPKNPKVTKAIKAEMRDSEGFSDDGILPNARANIRMMQAEMTHRDPEIAFGMRKMFYRLLALTDSVNASVPLATLNRIVGKDMGSQTAAATMQSEAFVLLRTRLRRIATALHKHGDYSQAMDDLTGMVARATFDNAEVRDIEKLLGADGLDRLSAAYRDVSKGASSVDEQFAGLSDTVKRKLDAMLERLAESMAVVTRGTVKRADVLNEHRWLSAYGDPHSMFEPDQTLSLLINREGLSPQVAASFTDDYMSSLSPEEATRMAYWGNGKTRVAYVKGANLVPSMGSLGDAFYVSDTPSRLVNLDDVSFDKVATKDMDEATVLFSQWQEIESDIAGAKRAIASTEDEATVDQLTVKVDALMRQSQAAEEALRAVGLEVPLVSPVVIRIDDTAKLLAFEFHGGDERLIKGTLEVLRTLEESPQRFSKVAAKLKGGVSGEQYLDVVRKYFAETYGDSADEQVGWLLRRIGYDSAMVSKGADAELVVFSDLNVRRLTDKFAEQQKTTHEIDGAPVQELLRRIMNDDLNDDQLGELVARMEDNGLDKRAGDGLIKMARGRDLNEPEIKALNKWSVRNLTDEGSQFMRRNKAGWIADKIKPEEGTGFFEEYNHDVAKRLMPIMEHLKKLEGYDSTVKRALFAINPKAHKQPKSFTRVIKAWRTGNIDKLANPNERKLATMMQEAMGDEWAELVDMGLASASGGRKNYVPQIWSGDRISANPAKFIENLAVFLQHKQEIDSGVPMDAGRAREIAERVFGTLTASEEGFIPPNRLDGTASEHLDAQRLLDFENYDPKFLNSMMEFMEDDLEGILVKYFTGMSRRKNMFRRFGHANHGYHDFMHTTITGRAGAVDLLTSGKLYKHKGANPLIAPEDTTELLEPVTAHHLFMPLFRDRSQAYTAVEKALNVMDTKGKQDAVEFLLSYHKGDDVPDALKLRVEAVVEGLDIFKGQPHKMPPEVIRNIDGIFDTLQAKNPWRHTATYGAWNMFSRGMRAFNSFTLLSYTMLTSLSDLALPLIRSGDFGAFVKGMWAYASQPEYRRMIRNVGVSMESLLHDRMANMYGQESGRWTNAFFNATGLTPWTNMMRGMAASVGYHTFVAEQVRALSYPKGSLPHKNALRILRRYGLADYLKFGDLSTEEAMNDPKVRKAIMRFTNEAVFSPNMNDIPLWGQHPAGAMIMQLKSFPLMMMRMFGNSVNEARHGRFTPLMATFTGLPLVSAGALYAKDIAQMRGGEDERSAEARDRGGVAEWYRDALIHSGGLGLLAETFYNIAEQQDNGAYGYQRTLGVLLGAPIGTGFDVFNVAAGIFDGEDSNAAERQGMRSFVGRLPVLGGNKAFKEWVVDGATGEANSGRAVSKLEGGLKGGLKGGL